MKKLIAAGLIALTATGSTPQITRPQKFIMEMDPNDSGTLKFHCHAHSTTGTGTIVAVHCERGL